MNVRDRREGNLVIASANPNEEAGAPNLLAALREKLIDAITASGIADDANWSRYLIDKGIVERILAIPEIAAALLAPPSQEQ